MLIRRLTPCVLLGLLSFACGGDGGGNGGSSGVPGDTTLIDLTPENAQKLCEFQERSYKNALPASEKACTLEAASNVDDSDECEEWRDQCIAEGDYDNEREDDWECESATLEELFDDDVPGVCEATVAEAEACMRSQFAAYGEAASRASCDDLTASDDEEFLYTEECRIIFDKCPGLDDDLFG